MAVILLLVFLYNARKLCGILPRKNGRVRRRTTLRASATIRSTILLRRNITKTCLPNLIPSNGTMPPKSSVNSLNIKITIRNARTTNLGNIFRARNILTMNRRATLRPKATKFQNGFNVKRPESVLVYFFRCDVASFPMRAGKSYRAALYNDPQNRGYKIPSTLAKTTYQYEPRYHHPRAKSNH